MRTSHTAGLPEDLVQTRWSLIQRLKNWNDQESWGEFFEAYWRLIYSMASKSGLTHAEAEEVVQETVLSVCRKIGEFRADPAAAGGSQSATRPAFESAAVSAPRTSARAV